VRQLQLGSTTPLAQNSTSTKTTSLISSFTPAPAIADLRSPEEIVAALTKRQQIKLASGLLSPQHMLQLGIITDDSILPQATPGEVLNDGTVLNLNDFGVVSVKKKTSNESTSTTVNQTIAQFPKSSLKSENSYNSTKSKINNFESDEKLVFEFSPGPLRSRKVSKTHTFKVSRAISKPLSGVINPPPLPSVKPFPQTKSLQRSSSSSR
jgi:hypothetical protein